MRERDSGFLVIFVLMGLITVVYAYAMGFVHMPKDRPWATHDETASIIVPPALPRPQPAKPRAPVCEGEIKGGFCVLK